MRSTIRLLFASVAALAALTLRGAGAHAVPAGYVDDTACAGCHARRFASYQHVGMARSLFRPRVQDDIEDFAAPPFYHAPSQEYLELRRQGDGVLFRRYQLAPDGAPINVFEHAVDWILGSGDHARTYLYRTPGGELYQLPLAWYSATREWAMAPGYDRRDHDGVTRRVRQECLFCHNAYADIPAEKLSYWRSQSVPAQLPEGIGCQRCHGPGAKHVDAAINGTSEEIRASIVNPSRLDARRKMDICYECHMLPAVALPAPRLFGRDIQSFRPGELLVDYAPAIDVTEAKLPRGERFEIDHHPYRLEQSLCFRASQGRLSCLTCHDPHESVPPAERVAHYRNACLGCHAQPHPSEAKLRDGDCTSCHMQKRRTQDVVHVVMTDHFIRRTPGGPELLAPHEEREPAVDGVEFRDPAHAPTGTLGELYRVIAYVRAFGGADAGAVQRLEQLMAELEPSEVEPYLDLAAAQLRQRRYPQLEQTASLVLQKSPGNALALEWLGFARAAQSGNAEDAIRLLTEALRHGGADRPETEFNLGVFLAGRGRTAEAIVHYERALAARPNLVAAWNRLGEARRECGDISGAVEAFRRALELDPLRARAYPPLIDALTAVGDIEEAARYREHVGTLGK